VNLSLHKLDGGRFFRGERSLQGNYLWDSLKPAKNAWNFGKAALAALAALARPNIREINGRRFKFKNLNTCDSSN